MLGGRFACVLCDSRGRTSAQIPAIKAATSPKIRGPESKDH
jgi:hypothetical protein